MKREVYESQKGMMYMVTMVTEGLSLTIRRGQCLALNEMAKMICEGN